LLYRLPESVKKWKSRFDNLPESHSENCSCMTAQARLAAISKRFFKTGGVALFEQVR
jgi:hypothetical protein